MAKNDLILIDSIIEDRVSRGIPSDKSDEVFEYLAYEQILKEYDLSSEELLSGSVDGRNDGGMDAIFIMVNGHLVTDINNEYFPKSNANLEVFFFTCKHSNTFKQDPINSIYTSLSELLDFGKKDSELDGDYNSEVLNKRSLFFTVYKKIVTIMEKFTIKVIFASRGDSVNEIGENVESHGKQIETLCKECFSGCEAHFEFWGAEKILAAFRKKVDYSLPLEVKEYLSHGKQMIVLARIKDYFNFITYDDSRMMRKYLFDSNVRDFMGINAVNRDVLDTLMNPRYNEDFWWLNNGITILCSSAQSVGKSITIENVQIVNGLQTSECIYRYFMSNGDIDDERVVLIKILPCDSKEIADDITRSTNNQTGIMSGALRATDKIQEDIEDILKKEDLYYERRVNFYANIGCPAERIFSPLYLARGYVALVLKTPYKAISLKQKFMRKQESYEEVFNKYDDIRIWPQIAKIMRKTDEYMSQLRGEGSGESFLRNVRYQVAFLTISRLHNSFLYTQKDLINFDIIQYSFDEVNKTWQDIMSVTSESTRYNWRSKRNSVFISLEIAKLEGISGFGAIEKTILNVSTKHRTYDFTDEFLNNVKKHLPEQPWPRNVNIVVAKEMGVSPRTISNAIRVLMDRKLVKRQLNGEIIE